MPLTVTGRSSPHSHASLKTAMPDGPNSEDNRYLALATYWQQYTDGCGEILNGEPYDSRVAKNSDKD